MKDIGTIINLNFEEYNSFLNRIKQKKMIPKSINVALEKMKENAVKEQDPSVNTNKYGYYAGYHFIKNFLNDWYDNYSEPMRHIEYLRNLYEYADHYHQPLHYIYADDAIVCLQLPEYSYAIPREYVTIQPFVDYSDIPVRQIGVNNELNAMLPAVDSGETQNSMQNKIDMKQDEISQAEDAIKAKKDEIEALKLEIEKRFAPQLQALNESMELLRQQKKMLEQQLFVLGTQVYGIRCFFGETVSFTHLVKGKNAPDETPVILHQKIRFLDEEMAKYAAIYGFDGDDTSMFEELLIHRLDMQELFFPGEKSISLVRISRDNNTYESGVDVTVSKSGNVAYTNVINKYKVYHGEQLAILIRNGENCYIGWTDDERIHLSDDDVFLKPQKETAVNPEDEKKTVQSSVTDVASRYFIFSIMQGVVLNSKLITLPEGIDIIHGNNKYVVFSMADAWLPDNTYGTFSDILKKYSGKIRKGDMLLTLQYLSAESNKDRAYNNDRGVGYNNRTHDVAASNNTLYPANYIETKSCHLFTYERRDKISFSDKYGEWEKGEKKSKAKTIDDFIHGVHNGAWKFPDSTEFRNIEMKESYTQEIFISLEKDENWRTGRSARANFQLFSDEYINLTFLNTVLIKYVITNRCLGNVFGRRNFASAVPYLNHALEYLKEREEEEFKLISPYAPLCENWQMELSEWKMENDVHVMTDYQAKRFAKWYLSPFE